MFAPGQQARIWLCTRATDMRKSYDGLISLARHQLQQDPLSGHYFVFVNRRKTMMKVLYFEPSGYCIWSKRLEQGQFPVRTSDGVIRSLGWVDLQLLLDGVEVKKIRQLKRYQRAA